VIVMQKRLILSVLTTVSFAPALTAQGASIWLPPKCEVKGANQFLVNSGLLYLKNATEKPLNRERGLQDAQRTLTQAVTTGSQDKNPAAWYYLGRYYAMRSDAAGADSAFRKAEELAPACHEDINFYRRNSLWVPIFNLGLAALNTQNYDSAVTALRAATRVYSGEPQGFTTLATVFFNMPPASYLPESTFKRQNPGLPDSVATTRYAAAVNTRYDSAAKYFRLGIQAAADPRFDKEKKDAMFNLGNAFYGAQHYDSAAAAYTDYLKAVPNDAQGRARLADVLTMGGHKDSAMATYRLIIQNADSAEPSSLFNAGVSIYNAAPPLPDSARISAACRQKPRAAGQTILQRKQKCDREGADSIARRDSAAVTNYQLAAQAFEAGLTREPLNRDGLFNLTSSYFAMHQADKMLPIAQRLVAVDPMNRNAVRMLAQAWQLKNKGDSALFYVTISDSLLPVDVSVGSFGPTDVGAKISGVVTNYHTKASVPLKLVFEFLNKAGTVVTTATADVPAIEGSGSHAFELQASGAGIISWRYKKG
jgi:tetratricopeptide (TPR) repeat protein